MELANLVSGIQGIWGMAIDAGWRGVLVGFMFITALSISALALVILIDCVQ